MSFFLLHLNENKQPVHMRYHLFLHYGWFLHNLGKDFIRLYVSINYLRKTEASKSLFIEILLISCTKQANLKYATLYYIGLFFSVPNAAYPPMHLSRRTAAMLQPPLLKTTSWCEKSFCSSCHFSFVFRFSGGDVKQPKNKGNQSRYIF